MPHVKRMDEDIGLGWDLPTLPENSLCSHVSSCEGGLTIRHPHSLTALQGSHLDRKETSQQAGTVLGQGRNQRGDSGPVGGSEVRPSGGA